MENNITIPSYINVENNPKLLEKAIKVFSDFGEDALVDHDRNIVVAVELYEDTAGRGVFFEDFIGCELGYLEPGSKEIFEKDLDEYLSMKNLTKFSTEIISLSIDHLELIEANFWDLVKPVQQIKKEVQLPEVGSFWVHNLNDSIAEIKEGSDRNVRFLWSGDNKQDHIVLLSRFLDFYTLTNKKYIVVNNVWCVAPVEEMKEGEDYFYPFCNGYVSYKYTQKQRSYTPHFTNFDDCVAYEKALLSVIEK